MADPDRKSSNVPKKRKAAFEKIEVVSGLEEKQTGRHPAARLPRLPKRLPNFVYEPLSFHDSTRILELLPGTGHDYIQCRLYEVTTDQAPQYEALSYVWGQPTDKRQILCCGRTINIPTNLRDLLQTIRNPFETKRLWADAICINQSDKTEVGHQLGQMASIYSTAERVIIWLGLEDPFESFGHDMYYLIDRYRKRLSERDASEASSPTAAITDDDEMHDFWICFGNLMRRPWFQRLWVVQEAGLARSAVALFGERELDFDVLSNTAKYLHVSGGGHQDTYSVPSLAKFEYFPVRRENSRIVTWEKNPDFLDMLEVTRWQRASDPRDYVFALLGHPSARVGGNLLIEPNYQKPHMEVFQELAIILLQQSRDLRLFSAVRHRDRSLLNNPSWIPTLHREGYDMRAGVHSENFKGYDAHAGFPRNLQLMESREVLQVHGIVFDTITESTKEFEYERLKKSSQKDRFMARLLAAAMALSMGYPGSIQETIQHIYMALSGYYRNLEQGLRDFAAFRLELSAMNPEQTRDGPGTLLPEGLATAREAAKEGNADGQNLKWMTWITRKRVFVTESGLIGAGPAPLRSGDLCCILFGGRVPFLLRPTESAYRLVGEAYINGVMQGEAVVDYMLGGKIRDQMFTII
jgi:hypothetical protein